MPERIALLSYRKDTLPQSGMFDGKPELFTKLKERDIQPLVSLNAESAFNENEVQVNELTSEYGTRAIGKKSLESVGAIINRLDRSFKYNEVQAETLRAIPTFNSNEMRSLAFRKHRVQSEILDPLGLGMPTLLVNTPLEAASFMHENPAKQYILKPTSGTFSEGIQRLTSREVIAFLAGDLETDKFIIQPLYNFEGALPGEIRPYDEASKEAFATWSTANTSKELRMYSFYSRGALDIFPVGRAIKDGVDHWFFVDPESVPQKLYDNTDAVVRGAADATGSDAAYAALDMAYGSLNGEDPAFHVVELNAKAPYLLGYDKHPQVADTLREKLADHVQHVTESKVK